MVLEAKLTRACNLGDPLPRHKPSERRTRSWPALGRAWNSEPKSPTRIGDP